MHYGTILESNYYKNLFSKNLRQTGFLIKIKSSIQNYFVIN